MCCRICQNRFNNELNFLEIDEEAKAVARQGFEAWSRSSFLEAASEVRWHALCRPVAFLLHVYRSNSVVSTFTENTCLLFLLHV